MYIGNLLINLVLCSSSSQATTVIPIFSGVGQVLGLTQQVVVRTFNFGDAGVSLYRWYRSAWK